MNAVWLFLYLGCLVRLLTLYRLDLNHPATLIMVLPILILPLMDRLCRSQPWLLRKGVVQGAGLAAFLSALAMARILNLGFWDTPHMGLAVLCALLGLGLSLVAHSLPRDSAGPGLWIWIAAWEFAGTWHPVLTFLGAGLSAFLGAYGRWPEGQEPVPKPPRAATMGFGTGSQGLMPSLRRVHPFWTLVLLGLVLPKPWFDFHLEGGWAPAMAVFALVAGLAGLPRVKEGLDRLPKAVPLVLLALAFFAYSSAWVLGWAAIVGLFWGVLWPRLPRPLSRPQVSLGFLLGLLVSYTLHSNLGIPFLGRLLWWGS